MHSPPSTIDVSLILDRPWCRKSLVYTHSDACIDVMIQNSVFYITTPLRVWPSACNSNQFSRTSSFAKNCATNCARFLATLAVGSLPVESSALPNKIAILQVGVRFTTRSSRLSPKTYQTCSGVCRCLFLVVVVQCVGQPSTEGTLSRTGTLAD